MVGLDSALEDWLKQVKELTNLTPDEQAKITSAGALVFKERLEETTRKKHYDHKRKSGGREHLADDIVIQKSDIDNRKTGVSSVGWSDGMNANIARWLNDGSKKLTGDHFVTELQQSKEVLEEVLAAEKEEYQKILRKRG